MEQHNRWKNHETWTVFIYLVNDIGLYELCEEFKANSNDWRELSDKLKAHFEEMTAIALENPSKEAVKLLLEIGSLCDVDFDQIAKELLCS